MTYKTPLERLETWAVAKPGREFSVERRAYQASPVWWVKTRAPWESPAVCNAHTLAEAVAKALGDENYCLIDASGDVWIYSPVCNGWHYVSTRSRWFWEGPHYDASSSLKGLDEGAAYIMGIYGVS